MRDTPLLVMPNRSANGLIFIPNDRSRRISKTSAFVSFEKCDRSFRACIIHQKSWSTVDTLSNYMTNGNSDAIQTLLTEIADAKDAYQTWKQQQPDAESLDARRIKWASQPFVRGLRSDQLDEWKVTEPGFASQPAVVAVRQRITDAQRELAQANAEFKALLQAGTPFQTYANIVGKAERSVEGILQRERSQRMSKVLQDLYGTDNARKLPRAMVDAARLNPSVCQFETFRFATRMGSLQPHQLTEQRLDEACDSVVAGLQELLVMVQS